MTEELVRRVTNTDRRERFKWIDPEGIRAFINSTKLLPLHKHAPMDLDVTNLSPEGAAQRILEHVHGFE